MASPQIENGFTRIANELLEALMTADLNGTQFRIMLAVIRESYGRQNRTTKLSYTRIAELVNQPRTVVGRNLKQLTERNFLTHNGGELSTWAVQKDYSRWLGSDQSVTSHQTVTSDQMVPKSSDQSVTRGSDQSVTQLKKDVKIERKNDGDAAAALKALGLESDQRRKVLDTRPDITLDEINAWLPWLESPPAWATKPVGKCYTNLLRGDPPPVEPKTTSRNGRQGPAPSTAPDFDMTEALRRAAINREKYNIVLPEGA